MKSHFQGLLFVYLSTAIPGSLTDPGWMTRSLRKNSSSKPASAENTAVRTCRKRAPQFKGLVHILATKGKNPEKKPLMSLGGTRHGPHV
jgi:hypothetical protein